MACIPIVGSAEVHAGIDKLRRDVQTRFLQFEARVQILEVANGRTVATLNNLEEEIVSYEGKLRSQSELLLTRDQEFAGLVKLLQGFEEQQLAYGAKFKGFYRKLDANDAAVAKLGQQADGLQHDIKQIMMTRNEQLGQRSIEARAMAIGQESNSQLNLRNELDNVRKEIINVKVYMENVTSQAGQILEILKDVNGGTLFENEVMAKQTAHQTSFLHTDKEVTNYYHSLVSRGMDAVHTQTTYLVRIFGDQRDRCWFRWLTSLMVWLSKFEEPRRYGCLASIVDSAAFEAVAMLIICANISFAIYTANWQYEHLSERPTATMQVVEIGFCCWFAVELLSRFAVHRAYFFVGPDAYWNIFDLVLVATSGLNILAQGVGSTTNVTFGRVLRTLKMLKVLRAIRLIWFVHELRLIFECLLGSIKSLVWCFLLTVFITGFFAILFVNNTASWIIESGAHSDSESVQAVVARFSTIQRTLLLLTQVSYGGLEWGEVYSDLLPTGFFNCAAFLLYLLVFQVAFLNIITSMFVEKAMFVARPDIEARIQQQQEQDLDRSRELFEVVRKHLDVNGTGEVTQEQFYDAMRDPSVRAAFTVREVPIRDAEMFFNVMASGGEESVCVEAFVAGCMRMRGHAMSSDLQILIVDVLRQSKDLHELVCQGRAQKASMNSLQQQVVSLMEKSEDRSGTMI